MSGDSPRFPNGVQTVSDVSLVRFVMCASDPIAACVGRTNASTADALAVHSALHDAIGKGQKASCWGRAPECHRSIPVCMGHCGDRCVRRPPRTSRSEVPSPRGKNIRETSDTVWTPYGTHGKTPDTVRAISGVRILFSLNYSLHGIR